MLITFINQEPWFQTLLSFSVQGPRGGSKIFSSGADFQKNFEKFVDLFLVDQIDFPIYRALPKHWKDPVLSKFWKNRPKRRFRVFFGKCFFFCERSPLKMSIYWKIFRVCHQKWISQNSTKGTFESSGGRIPEESQNKLWTRGRGSTLWKSRMFLATLKCFERAWKIYL